MTFITTGTKYSNNFNYIAEYIDTNMTDRERERRPYHSIEEKKKGKKDLQACNVFNDVDGATIRK